MIQSIERRFKIILILIFFNSMYIYIVVEVFLCVMIYNQFMLRLFIYMYIRVFDTFQQWLVCTLLGIHLEVINS